MKMLSGFKSSRLNGVIRTVLISVATFLLIFVLILAGISPDTYDIHVGEPASKTIYATKDVEDTVTTEALREAAANAVEPIYRSMDPSVNATVLEDMEAAYQILKGKKIADGVRGIIIPGTMAVYKECLLRGWAEAFIDAGCIVSTPTCGPCLGGYMGILAEGERCVSTTNRNFVGRMGHVTSEVYLASPATAAASALTGVITDPREV